MKENLEVELKMLRAEQSKTREDEVFGGLTLAERTALDAKTRRINQLEIELANIVIARKSVQTAQANQRVQWNKEPETDTPQGKTHQPYRSRESDSANPSHGSSKRVKTKRESDKKRSD